VQKLIAGPRGVRGHLERAAVAAGYSDGPGLKRQVQTLTHDPWVKEEIAKSLTSWDVTKERVIAELARIAYADIAEIVDIDQRGGMRLKDGKRLNDLPPEITSTIQEIKEVPVPGMSGATCLQIKLHDKKPALELLAKFLQIIKTPDVTMTIIQVMQNLNLTMLGTDELLQLQTLLEKAAQRPATLMPMSAKV
jgi:hypothetical protein